MNKILNDLKAIGGFFIFPILVLIAHLILVFFFKIYLIFPKYDILMHFVGGISIGYTSFLSLKYLQKRKYFTLNTFFRVLFVLALVSLTALLWEFFEFLASYITGMGLQGNLVDTMADLFFGLLGGLFIILLLER
jgi:uncharacterized membrane protein YjdF|tara:strand:- start:51 stop:455 length:405 start_codon:yes stop_codon:yes gene_type:complete